jgi:hypothetical protein
MLWGGNPILFHVIAPCQTAIILEINQIILSIFASFYYFSGFNLTLSIVSMRLTSTEIHHQSFLLSFQKIYPVTLSS